LSIQVILLLSLACCIDRIHHEITEKRRQQR
jgi:hypothetical protein